MNRKALAFGLIVGLASFATLLPGKNDKKKGLESFKNKFASALSDAYGGAEDYLENKKLDSPEQFTDYLNDICWPSMLTEAVSALAEANNIYAMGSTHPGEISSSAVYSTLANLGYASGSAYELFWMQRRFKEQYDKTGSVPPITKITERIFDGVADLARIGTGLYFTTKDATKFFDAREIAGYNTRPDRAQRRAKIVEFLLLGISYGVFPSVRFWFRPTDKSDGPGSASTILCAVIRCIQAAFEAARRHHRYQLEFGDYEDMDPDEIPQQVIIYRESGAPLYATVDPQP